MRGVAFGPSAASPDPNYDPSVMTAEAMMTLCAAKPSICHFVEGGGDWAAHSVPTSTRFTTFISNSTCRPVTAKCGGGQFLQCPGRDVMAPLVPMEHYGLRKELLADICVDMGCDLFVSANDGSGGTLFKFAAVLVSCFPMSCLNRTDQDGVGGRNHKWASTACVPPLSSPTGCEPVAWRWRYSYNGDTCAIGLPGIPYGQRVTMDQCITACGSEPTCLQVAMGNSFNNSYPRTLPAPPPPPPPGSMLWKHGTGDAIYSSPRLGSIDITRCADEGQECTCTGTAFYGVDGLDFNTMLTKPYASKPAANSIMCSDSVFGGVIATSKQCFCVSSGGSTHIYFGSQDRHLRALNADGTLRFIPALQGAGIQSTAAVDAVGNLYVGCDSGIVTALHHDGTLSWTFTTGGRVTSSPAIGPLGQVFVGSFDGYLYALDRNGALDWKFQTGSAVQSSPCVGPDGVVYFGSTDHFFYALHHDVRPPPRNPPFRTYPPPTPLCTDPLVTRPAGCVPCPHLLCALPTAGDRHAARREH